MGVGLFATYSMSSWRTDPAAGQPGSLAPDEPGRLVQVAQKYLIFGEKFVQFDEKKIVFFS